MTELLNPHCPRNQESYLTHHQVELYFEDGWGLGWKNGFMGDISLKPDRAEACAIAALFVHWWLYAKTELDPGELIRAAWFFHNPQTLAAAKLEHTDPDSVLLFAFVEEQLALYSPKS